MSLGRALEKWLGDGNFQGFKGSVQPWWLENGVRLTLVGQRVCATTYLCGYKLGDNPKAYSTSRQGSKGPCFKVMCHCVTLTRKLSSNTF